MEKIKVFLCGGLLLAIVWLATNVQLLNLSVVELNKSIVSHEIEHNSRLNELSRDVELSHDTVNMLRDMVRHTEEIEYE